jgi:hypothetical protein
VTDLDQDIIAREVQPSSQPQQESGFAIWTSALAKFGFQPQVTDTTPAGWTILSERAEQDVSFYTKVVLVCVWSFRAARLDGANHCNVAAFAVERSKLSN